MCISTGKLHRNRHWVPLTCVTAAWVVCKFSLPKRNLNAVSNAGAIVVDILASVFRHTCLMLASVRWTSFPYSLTHESSIQNVNAALQTQP